MFTVTAALGSSSSPTDVGLFHSTDSGSTFTTISGISEAQSSALDATASGSSYQQPSWGGDEGINWVKINDDASNFGATNANTLTAEQKTYGRDKYYSPTYFCIQNHMTPPVYVGTNGRGVFNGNVVGSSPSATAIVTATTITKATRPTSNSSTKSATTTSHSATSKSTATTHS
ncbi:hypothetical protein FISHEDRAFT_73885 [Fistulina hepatica ATCC 64428]|uniref:Uncharacterized protein n=1 Tax=Fistulina hepatica ATCC 64428 TaxID=1128425 RepID=A0A0D7AEN0_9AGAR|nr:hypothetical protein FISHEDRAFT_73885 [Fistulina hepatica ATCC 64428]